MTEQEKIDQEQEQLWLRGQLKEIKEEKTKLQQQIDALYAKEKEVKGKIVPKKDRCNVCKGSGKVDRSVGAGTYEARCDFCQGKGQVEEQIF